ncbi:hypothetical protein KKB99_03990, partial [bacterium]|nr:hypothetical protein [bacterium]MBU1025154.1 hypothetical protein [bacterium]
RHADPKITIANFTDILGGWSGLELSESLKKVNEMVIEKSADGTPHDDVTVLAIEVMTQIDSL